MSKASSLSNFHRAQERLYKLTTYVGGVVLGSAFIRFYTLFIILAPLGTIALRMSQGPQVARYGRSQVLFWCSKRTCCSLNTILVLSAN